MSHQRAGLLIRRHSLLFFCFYSPWLGFFWGGGGKVQTRAWRVTWENITKMKSSWFSQSKTVCWRRGRPLIEPFKCCLTSKNRNFSVAWLCRERVVVIWKRTKRQTNKSQINKSSDFPAWCLRFVTMLQQDGKKKNIVRPFLNVEHLKNPNVELRTTLLSMFLLSPVLRQFTVRLFTRVKEWKS